MNIVRLTFDEGLATSRLLPSSELTPMMRNPLLRSTGVLSALFSKYVVVTEADSDRAFYQEINERQIRQSHSPGIPNCLFLNSPGKHTIRTIVEPLRRMGIPAAGIFDVDVLKDGGAAWIRLLTAAGVPQISHESLGHLRSVLHNALIATGKDMKGEGGIDLLTTSDREAAENLLLQMADYGLFVVPGGELESWLKGLGASGHGPSWIVDIFQRMGEQPQSPDYVHPGQGDVWAFMSRVVSWLVNPRRKGIPQ